MRTNACFCAFGEEKIEEDKPWVSTNLLKSPDGFKFITYLFLRTL
jgi:hypothetical protein